MAGGRASRLLRTAAVGAQAAARAGARAATTRTAGAAVAPVVDAFQQLGGTYVKLGQLVGSAPGMFGRDVSAAFRRLLDTGPPVPFPEVAATVEADLGRPLQHLFATFDARPLAAASLAVVHRATLRTGEAVAVKVLRPGIAGLVATDLALLTPLAAFLTRQGVEPLVPLHAFLVGLEHQLRDELDLRVEAAAMNRFRERYRAHGIERIVIPRVFDGLSGRHTLTMELLDGVAIDDPAAADWDGADPRTLLLELLRAWFVSAVLDGEFHGDLHAGNLMLLRDGRLGLVDWGILARLDPATHWLLRRLLEACLGDTTGWRDIAEAYRRAGVTANDELGLSDRAAAPLVRAQFEPLLTRPFGRVDLRSLIVTSRQASAAARGEERAETWRERLERLRGLRRASRRIVDDGLRHSHFDRANMLMGRQLMYVERFGKLYLPDVALLHDRRFIRTLLRTPGPPSPIGPGADPEAFTRAFPGAFSGPG